MTLSLSKNAAFKAFDENYPPENREVFLVIMRIWIKLRSLAISVYFSARKVRNAGLELEKARQKAYSR